MTGRKRGLHHVALGARDVERVAEFYRDVFELRELVRHHEAEGTLRSVWLALDEHDPPAVLMVERTDATRARVTGVGAGPFLLAFHVESHEREALEQRLEKAGATIESRTSASSYARDPESNRVAVSSYTVSWPESD